MLQPSPSEIPEHRAEAGATKPTKEGQGAMARLTKRAVEAAKATGKGWTWIGDQEVPGFGVRVYSSGRKVYSLRYRTDSGRQRMMKLGVHGELTVEQARGMAMREKLKVLEGGDPLAQKRKAEAEVRTVKHLMDRWIEEHARAHRKSHEEDRRRVDARIVPALGRLPLEDLSVERLASWHRNTGEDSPVEANRCLETLRAAWRWAERQEILPDEAQDPTGKVKRFRERSRDRWLRRGELERLLRATAQEEDPFVRAAVPLLLLTGLRKGELLSARWRDVDLRRAEIRLPETKSGEAQVRLLPSPAVTILQDLPRVKGSPFVFPSPVDKNEHRRDFKKPWIRIRRTADLEDVTLHDLRRTAGSYMAQAGVPLEVITKVLGQTHPAVTKVYARLASENERAALETLASELTSIMRASGTNGGRPKEPEESGDIQSRLEALVGTAEDPQALAERLRAMAEALEASES